MNKKFVITGITCIFLIISGICYSCSFRGTDSKLLPTSSEREDELTKDPGDLTNENRKEEELSQEQKDGDPKVVLVEGQEELQNVMQVYIHICGAVANPGVYQVASGARIYDLIRMSGGLTKEAAGDYINQARQVSDGERIYIPMKSEVENLTPEEYVKGEQTSDQETKESSSLININTADAQALMTLPGIGQSKADSILDYRTKNGNFKTIEELMNISGIKEGLFSKISPYITVK